jgi:hypothetical protein
MSAKNINLTSNKVLGSANFGPKKPAPSAGSEVLYTFRSP